MNYNLIYNTNNIIILINMHIIIKLLNKTRIFEPLLQ